MVRELRRANLKIGHYIRESRHKFFAGEGYDGQGSSGGI